MATISGSVQVGPVSYPVTAAITLPPAASKPGKATRRRPA